MFTMSSSHLGYSITLQHTVNKITQRSPEIFPTSFFQVELVHEQDVVLEACVQMWFKTKMYDNRIVMAIDMCVYSIESFEKLLDG